MSFRESAMDTSIGSDGEESPSCDSPTTPPVSPVDKGTLRLKFSIDNILRPEFGLKRTTPSPTGLSLKTPPTPTDPLKQDFSNSIAFSRPCLPAWVFCTRYSDRPSSGPRCRKLKRKQDSQEEKRPRTAFTTEQLNRLKTEFQASRYLTEKRRQELAHELGLNESQIKIWFQNKRAKIKKLSGARNPLAFALMTQGLYNHATVPVEGEQPLN